MELKWKRNRDTSALPFFEHTEYIPFNVEGWHVVQISNINELVSQLEPEFKTYLQSISNGPPESSYATLSNKGKSILSRAKEWLKSK